MRVWDIATGKKMFEFKAWTGESSVLTSMAIDEQCTRFRDAFNFLLAM